MDALKELRRQKGWSQKDLSEYSGVGQDTISGIESGRHEPRPSTLRKLAGALEVEVADFFKEPIPLGEAPPPSGASLLDRAQEAAREDAEKDSRMFARLHASEGVPQTASEYEEDKLRAEMRRRGFPDEYFEDFIWPLVLKAVRADQLEQELTRLREVSEREAAQHR